MHSSSQLKYGAIISYIAIGINILSGLFYTPWMIHSIGRENFGLYTLALSVISLFVFDFGLSSAVTRFVAKYLAEGRQDRVNNCLGLVCRLYLILDILLLIILTGVYFFIPYIYRELSPEEIEKFKIVYMIAATFSVFSFPFIPANGILAANEKFVQLKGCDIFHKLFIVIAMTICLLAGYGLYALIIVNVTSGVLTILAKLYVIRSRTDTKINFTYKNRGEFKEILGYSGWVTIISLSQRLIFNIAPSILGALSGSVGIAILGVAITLEGYTYTFANAINGMFLPKVSRVVAQNEVNVLPLMIRIGRIQIFLIGLLVIGFICLGRNFIDLWVGEDFRDTYLCALFLIIPSFFHLPQEIADQTVLAMNKVKLKAFIFLFMAVFNMVFAILLASKYGAIGICISICCAYFIRTIGMDIIYYKTLKIDIPQFFKSSFIAMGIPLTCSFIASLFISYIIPLDNWAGLVIKGILVVVAYCAIMISFALNRDERHLLTFPLNSILHRINRR